MNNFLQMDDWYKYLSGLIDSDGNIYLEYKKTKTSIYPNVRIQIFQKFPTLLFNLKNIFKIGNVYKTGIGWTYEFTGKQSKFILSHIQKNIILKQKQVLYCLTVLNKAMIGESEKITYLRHNEYVFKEISVQWFGGFFDGDGCLLFDKNNRTRLMITIDGRDIDFIENIKNSFGGHISKSGNNKRWYLEINKNNLDYIKKLSRYVILKQNQFSEMFCYYKNGISKYKEISELKKFDNISIIGNIDGNDYQKWSKTTAIYPKSNSISYLSLGLAGECGEISNKVKKIIRDDENIISVERKTELMLELSDILWYLARLSDELGFKLNDIMEENILKLEKRFNNGVIHGSGDNR